MSEQRVAATREGDWVLFEACEIKLRKEKKLITANLIYKFYAMEIKLVGSLVRSFIFTLNSFFAFLYSCLLSFPYTEITHKTM